MEIPYIYKHLEDSLKELSSIELQKKLWLNINNDTGLISSYSEFYNNFFEDLGAEIFFENILSKSKANRELIIAFQKIIKMLNDYKEPDIYSDVHLDEYIINDPNWQKISNYAQTVLRLWENEHFE